MYIGDLFEIICLLDVILYFFDFQMCYLEMFFWSVDGSKIRFIILILQIFFQFYIMNSMWELDKIYIFVLKRGFDFE